MSSKLEVVKTLQWNTITITHGYAHTSIVKMPVLFWIPEQRKRDDVIVAFHHFGGSKEVWLNEEHNPLLTYAIETGTPFLLFDGFGHGEWHVEGATTENLITEYWDEMMEQTGIAQSETFTIFKQEKGISLSNLIFVGESHGCDMALDLISFRGIKPAIYVAAAFSPYRKYDIKRSAHNNLASYKGLDLLIIAGRFDEYNEEGEVQWLYDQIESDRKELFFFDSGHELPVDLWIKKVVAFIAQKQFLH